MNDMKEEEPLIDERERSRVQKQNMSPILQLQQLLEQLRQIKMENNIPDEEFKNTIAQFIESVDHDDEETMVGNDYQFLYTNALQIIGQKENEITQKNSELNQAHLQCRSMAMQLATYKQKYRIGAANDDIKEQQMTVISNNDITDVCDSSLNDIDSSQNMNSYETESDCSISSSNSSDYQLVTNDVTFKPMDEYEPISFKKSCNLLNDNKYIFCDEYSDEYDGIQSDWQCQSNDIDRLEEEDEYEDEEEEDEYVQLINALNSLHKENEELRNDNKQKSQIIKDIYSKYQQKCIEYDNLKCKLNNTRQNN